ncbi:methyl-accepting chemotaxis protein [Thermacetogenium phaeum]|uniref:methyl-accepting chemotaxis protein n=1 Tax=Thermacetogenium phaeum TaxID=85874 RepID=UPI0022A91034|nr:methyl-accepting chemotaxis protein [Thermacetogenium phaeum]
MFREPARAGEYGKGFVVVADEVWSSRRRLLTRAAELFTIEQDMKAVNAGAQEIVDNSAQIAAALDQARKGVEQIATAAQEAASASEEAAAAARQQAAGAGELERAIEEIAAMADELQQL